MILVAQIESGLLAQGRFLTRQRLISESKLFKSLHFHSLLFGSFLVLIQGGVYKCGAVGNA